MCKTTPLHRGGTVLALAAFLHLGPATAATALEGETWRVLQSALEGRPRTITVVFENDLYAAWDTRTCAFLSAWTVNQGSTDAQRRILAHGTPRGSGWLLRRGEEVSALEPHLRSYRREAERLILDCELRSTAGDVILVQELPQLIRGAHGEIGLERVFRTFNVPEGIEVWLDVSHDPMPSRRRIQSDGDLRLRSKQFLRRLIRQASEVAGQLLLRPNTTTRLTILFEANRAPRAALDPATATDLAAEEEPEPGPSIATFNGGEGAATPSPGGAPQDEALVPGLVQRLYSIRAPIVKAVPMTASRPNISRTIRSVDLASPSDFGGLRGRFRTQISGFLLTEEDGEYGLRLTADDDAELWIDEHLVVGASGLFTADQRTEVLRLGAGRHALRIEHFQNLGPRVLKLEWKPPGSTGFELVPAKALVSSARELHLTAPGDKTPTPLPSAASATHSSPAVNPAFDFEAVPMSTPDAVSGLAFFKDGRLALLSGGSDGALYVASGLFEPATSGRIAAPMQIQTMARGLRFPLAVKTVGQQVFVLQQDGLLQLIDLDGDDRSDEIWTFAEGWSAAGSAVAGGLQYFNRTFYASIQTREPGSNPSLLEETRLTIDSRGDWSLNPDDTRAELEENGLGAVEEHLPSAANLSRILFLDRPECWFRGLSEAFPGEPARLASAPYEGHLAAPLGVDREIHRIVLDRVGDQLQATVLHFARFPIGFGPAPLATGPDGSLVVARGTAEGPVDASLVQLKPSGSPTFEILNVRSRANGFEIQLTEPLAGGIGWDVDDYILEAQWWEPANEPGAIAERHADLKVLSASVSFDRQSIFLETLPAREESLIHFRLNAPLVSASGQSIWSNEAWVAFHRAPTDEGEIRVAAPPTPPNRLSADERRSGWRLLFDGESLHAWRGFQGNEAPSAWRADEGLLFLQHGGERGDLISRRSYRDFELVLEWAVAPKGNSGILFRVGEGAEPSHWTGLEFQILDDPEGRAPAEESAGANHALHPPRYSVARGPLQFNRTRIRVEGNHVEHWLNDYKIVDYELGDDDWKERVAKSQFAQHAHYGRLARGHIVLQDHGSEVWFRNIKLREL